MLEKIGTWNDITDELRAELEKKVDSMGTRIRIKFHISHPNPDPEKYNGPIVWPSSYALDPITFRIVDPYEKRPGKSKSKLIGLIDEIEDKNGQEVPKTFHRVRVLIRHLGILSFDPTNQSDRYFLMYLLLHPKLMLGKFLDKNRKQMFEFVDEKKEAIEGRERRNVKAKALHAATNMSEQQVRDFASAMVWDETEDPDMLRNKVEEVAEINPEMFSDLINGKQLEYQAVIKRALDKLIIGYNPSEQNFIWPQNQQVFASLNPTLTEKNPVERLAEWVMTGGQKNEEVYKKIKALVKS
jgi:hypothetical protein